MDTSRDRMLMLGAAVLVVAVLLGLGLRALLNSDDDAESDVDTAVTVPSDDADNDESENSGSDEEDDGDSSDTTEPDDKSDSDSEETTSSTTEPSSTVEPTMVELSGLTMTRTGECQSVTVGVDSIISVASDGTNTSYMFPDDGTLLEGTVTERTVFEVGDEITESVGDDWTVSVFSREHLSEGAYSENHSSPVSASGRYPGPSGLQVAYQIAESNGQLSISPLDLSVSSDCQTVAPLVLISFNSPGGSGTVDNGGASQMPANFEQPIPLLDPARFDLADGWTMTVFVRDDWSGRSLSMNHDAPAQVSEVLAATAAGDPELTISYSVSVG